MFHLREFLGHQFNKINLKHMNFKLSVDKKFEQY